MRTVAILSVLALAACSSGGGSGGNAAAGGGSGGGGSSGGGAAVSDINVADACAALPREVVEQTIGMPLKSAELKDVRQDADSGMASSGCVYDFGEARLVQLHLTRMPNGRDSSSSQATLREMYSQMGAAAQDVPGLGQSAFFVPKAGEEKLSVQIDAGRTALLSLFRLESVPDPKGKLIALAHRVVG